MIFRLSALAAVVLSIAGPAIAADEVRIAVLDFELNDLTLDPGTPEERARTASIGPLLRQELAELGFGIVEIDAERQRQADQGFGYLFQHDDVAAELGRSAGGDFIVVGRVHKASFLFVYFKARLVDCRTGRLVGDFVVEVKGPQQKLTIKGVEALALQIAAAIEAQPAQR